MSTLTRRSVAAAAAAAAPPAAAAVPRYAVVGAGFAGLACAYHLLRRAGPAAPLQLDLIDAHGLGAGGSGAAAGLLHPMSPRGAPLWRAADAFPAALALLRAAEAAADPAAPPLAWRSAGALRPAASPREAANLEANLPAGGGGGALAGARLVSPAEMAALVPGLGAAPLAAGSGMHVPDAVVLHPQRYMAALWRACLAEAARAGGASAARLVAPAAPVASLAALEAERGPYNGIIVAAGAAVGAIREAAALAPLLSLVAGDTLEVERAPGGEGGGYPAGAPSLLGSTYVAAHGADELVVGATRRRGLAPADALAACGAAAVRAAGGGAAARALLAAGAGVWPPLAGPGWRAARVRSGVRAQPAATHAGKLPYAGRLPAAAAAGGGGGEPPNWWVVAGLGARGLVYHAWLGGLVAAAAAARDERGLPPELLRWRGAAPRGG